MWVCVQQASRRWEAPGPQRAAGARPRAAADCRPLSGPPPRRARGGPSQLPPGASPPRPPPHASAARTLPSPACCSRVPCCTPRRPVDPAAQMKDSPAQAQRQGRMFRKFLNPRLMCCNAASQRRMRAALQIAPPMMRAAPHLTANLRRQVGAPQEQIVACGRTQSPPRQLHRSSSLVTWTLTWRRWRLWRTPAATTPIATPSGTHPLVPLAQMTECAHISAWRA